MVDMRDVYAECEKKYGKPIDLATKSTYNPKTKKFFGFSPSFVPDPINWRKDLWDDVGVVPDSWEKILDGGRKIKQKHNIPVGIGLAQELDTAMACAPSCTRYGAHEQDAAAYLAIEFQEYGRGGEICESAVSGGHDPGSLYMGPVFQQSGHACRHDLTGAQCDFDHAHRRKRQPGVYRKSPSGKGGCRSGPANRPGTCHGCLRHLEVRRKYRGAKKFLVDYVGNFRQAFLNGEFYDFPCFQRTVPVLKQLLSNDAKAKPADKYKVLEDVLSWATNIGYPGYANAAIDEIYQKWVIHVMFAKAAQGVLSPEDAVKEAEAKCAVSGISGGSAN